MKSDRKNDLAARSLEDRIAECERRLATLRRDGRTREEKYWAAGLFDGEGHVSARSTQSGFDCSLEQVEADLINLVRLRNAVGVGTISELSPRDDETRQRVCKWSVTNQSDLNVVFAMIGPFLNPAKLNGRTTQSKSAPNPPSDGFSRALAVPLRTILTRDSEMPDGAIEYETEPKPNESKDNE